MSFEQRTFFAGRRCFHANGTKFLVLFGLSPHAEQNYDVLEGQLLSFGINLGNFLIATVTPDNILIQFKLISYPLQVTLNGDFAIINLPTAEAIRGRDNSLVFQTKQFGPIKSVNQEIPLGFYKIAIKSIDSTTNYNITLCAEAKATSQSPIPSSSISNTTFHHFFNRNVNTKEAPLNQGIPKTSSESSETLDELIGKLPIPNVFESRPVPKPRTISSFSGYKKNPKPTMKVQPNKSQSSNESSQMTTKVMKAFVHSVVSHEVGPDFHFLWICDIKEDAFFKIPGYKLSIGHFFEGVFQNQGEKGWNCIEYKKQISPLIKGSMVYGKMELTTTISKYQEENLQFKYPQAFAKHLGVVIDRYSKLSPNCDGQKVNIKRQLLDGKPVWVITGLEQ